MYIRTLFLLLIPCFCFAQKKDTVSKYLDGNLRLTTEKNAVYYGVAIRQNNHWLLYAVYSDNSPLLKIYYKDNQLRVKDGPFTMYYPGKFIAQQGNFINNKMNGIWQTWNPNGKLKDSGYLVDNIMTGLWKTWNTNGDLMVACTYKEKLTESEQTLLKVQQANADGDYNGIRDGNFTSWYTNNQIESSGTYKNDQLDGEWHWHYENGQLSTIEQYIDGKLTNIKCFDTTGLETGDYCSIEKPAILKGFGDYKQFIQQNLVWPQEAIKKRIEGEVKVHIKINRKGEIENLIITGDQEVLKKAVADLFQQMKDWYPAISHNRVIEWEDEVTIPFYLNN
jgi:TonB family protein